MGAPKLATPCDEVVARYVKKYRFSNLVFAMLDKFLATLPIGQKKALSPAVLPRKILLSNAGHLGDVIISTGLLPVLHSYFPGVEIGILCGSWASPIVSQHPLIAHIHFLDHWYLQRKNGSIWKKFSQYHFEDKKNVISEISMLEYDVAIDVRSWFPNLIPILWQSNIPIRIAYNRVGFGPLLTHSMSYKYGRRHELEYQFDLLKILGVESSALGMAKPSLPPVAEAAAYEAHLLVGSLKRYRVLHVASSTPSRDWPISQWQLLAKNLIARNITPVLTGQGSRDALLISEIVRAAPNSIVACDILSWAGLVALVEGSEMIYSVETSIGHMAAALGKPVVSIYGGMADPFHWKPYGDQVVMVTNPLRCSPCFKKYGCDTRECLNQLSVSKVIEADHKLSMQVIR